MANPIDPDLLMCGGLSAIPWLEDGAGRWLEAAAKRLEGKTFDLPEGKVRLEHVRVTSREESPPDGGLAFEVAILEGKKGLVVDVEALIRVALAEG